MPDNVDALRDSGQWVSTGFDDASWPAAVPVDGASGGPLHPRSIPLLREEAIENLAVVAAEPATIEPGLPMRLPAGAEVVFDCGREVQGYSVLDFDASHGARLEVSYPTRFSDAGRSPHAVNMKGHHPNRYTACAGRQTWMSTDTFGCKYVAVRVTGGRITLHGLRMVDRRYPFQRLGRFTSSESWRGGSFVHESGAHPAYFLSSYVLGVRTEGPRQARRLVIDPRLGDLDRAEGTTLTEFGPVSVRWKRGGNGALTFEVDNGATVVWAGPAPTKCPTLTDYPQRDEQLKSVVAELFADSRLVTFKNNDLAGLVPIVEKSAAPPAWKSSGDVAIRFVHRRTTEAEIFFLVNRAPNPVKATITFRVTGRTPELWDPSTGRITPVPYEETSGGVQVPVRMPVLASTFLVFRNSGRTEPPVATIPFAAEATTIRQIEIAGPWQLEWAR